MIKRTILSILLGISLVWAAPAGATVLIQKGKIRLNVKPGEKIIDSMTVYNTKNKPIEVRAYWQDFRYVQPYDGTKEFLPSGSLDYTCHDWVSFNPKRFRLPPFGSIEISYSINVPADAKGGHYGVMFFEAGAEQAGGQAGLSIVTRIGSLFFLETNDKSKASQVTGLKATPDGFAGTFENQGNVILIPAGNFYVMDAEGLIVERGEMAKMYLPPGASKAFEIKLGKDFPKGKATTVVTFDLEDGVSFVKEIDFTKDTSGYKILKVND